MDSAQGDANREYKETNAEAVVKEDDLPIPGNKPESEEETSCSSSTSDDSSEEDFFQLDASELDRAVEGSSEFLCTQHGDNAQLASESRIENSEATGICQSTKHGTMSPSENEGILDSSQVPMERPISSDVSGGTLGSDLSILGARQSPPVQVMNRTDVPDPNRIPSSIFARSMSSTPMEWSVASNESLFSIHMGNSSFSGDHVILLGISGELGLTPPLPLLDGSRPMNTDVGQGLAQPGLAAAANAEAMKDVLRSAAEGHADKVKLPVDDVALSQSISHRSDGSTTSFRSFAFPILTEGRSGSVKVEPEPQQPQWEPPQHSLSETPKVALAAARNKWCSCFSCCVFCR